jgi:hypothetical protein
MTNEEKDWNSLLKYKILDERDNYISLNYFKGITAERIAENQTLPFVSRVHKKINDRRIGLQ